MLNSVKTSRWVEKLFWYLFFYRRARRNAPTVLLVCLCASMIIYNVTFLAGISNPDAAKSDSKLRNEGRRINSDEAEFPDKGTCTLVTVLLQYFLLATFSFNTLYAADLFLLLRRRSGHFTIIYMILGWGKSYLNNLIDKLCQCE